MTEAPLEALKRLESKLEYLQSRTTYDTKDLEDAVNVVRDLIDRLKRAGVPLYGEPELARFLQVHYEQSGHSFDEAARRFGETLKAASPLWVREASGYALAYASRGNWTVAVNAHGDAFERLQAARLHAEDTLRTSRDGMSDLDRGALLAYQEICRAFLECTTPEAITGWLREYYQEES